MNGWIAWHKQTQEDNTNAGKTRLQFSQTIFDRENTVYVVVDTTHTKTMIKLSSTLHKRGKQGIDLQIF